MYTYIVKPGESAAMIAAKFGGKEDELVRINSHLPRKVVYYAGRPINVFSNLFIGQKLIIPSNWIHRNFGVSSPVDTGSLACASEPIGIGDTTDTTNVESGPSTDLICQSGMHKECTNEDCKCVQNDNTVYWLLGGLGVILLAGIGVSAYRAYRGMPEPGVVYAPGGGVQPVLPLREPRFKFDKFIVKDRDRVPEELRGQIVVFIDMVQKENWAYPGKAKVAIPTKDGFFGKYYYVSISDLVPLEKKYKALREPLMVPVLESRFGNLSMRRSDWKSTEIDLDRVKKMELIGASFFHGEFDTYYEFYQDKVDFTIFAIPASRSRYSKLEEPMRVPRIDGDFVSITYKGEKVSRFMPDVKIMKDKPRYVLYPMHGFSHSLAVEDGNGQLIGWMPIDVLGFANVKEWMKAVNYIV